MKNYDQWKLSNADDERMDDVDPRDEYSAEDEREAWLAGVVDQIKTSQDEVAPHQFGWTATVGDFDLDSPVGRGATEAEAIQDLLERLEH